MRKSKEQAYVPVSVRLAEAKRHAKTVVGNCPRCGLPIYEVKGAPEKSCGCRPLADAWTPIQIGVPVPQPYVPLQPWPYSPQTWPTIIYSGGTSGAVTTTSAPVPYTLT